MQTYKHAKRRKTAGKAAERKKKPYNLKARRPHEIIEFDMKQINLPGKTLYALCTINQYTRRPAVHTSNCFSAAGKTALQKIKQRFTKDIIINDNGSENMGKAEQWLKEEKIAQYWYRANKPKDKPFIEWFIGTLQTECPAFHYDPMDVYRMQQIIDELIFKYENRRPHEG